MLTNRTTRQARTILWIALLAMVFVGAVNHVRINACVGDCCEQMAAAMAQAAETQQHDTESTCCCCCEHEREEDDGGEEARGRCAPGCCITLAFDVELAPSIAKANDLPPAELAFGDVVFAPFESPPRQIVRVRPFDRGPPRIDRLTSLRAHVVLLI